jgi:hypothetical protein
MRHSPSLVSGCLPLSFFALTLSVSLTGSTFCIHQKHQTFLKPLVQTTRRYPSAASNYRFSVTQVFLDATLFAPVALSSFYIGLTALEGKSTQEIYQEWKNKFPITWKVREMSFKELSKTAAQAATQCRCEWSRNG